MSGVRIEWELKGGAMTLSAATSTAWGILSVVREVRDDAQTLSRSLDRSIEIRSSRGVLLCTVDGRPS